MHRLDLNEFLVTTLKEADDLPELLKAELLALIAENPDPKAVDLQQLIGRYANG